MSAAPSRFQVAASSSVTACNIATHLVVSALGKKVLACACLWFLPKSTEVNCCAHACHYNRGKLLCPYKSRQQKQTAVPIQVTETGVAGVLPSSLSTAEA